MAEGALAGAPVADRLKGKRREAYARVVSGGYHGLAVIEAIRRKLLVVLGRGGFERAAEEMSVYHVRSHADGILGPFDDRVHIKAPVV